ncbi:coilin [Euphorbia lathyris]|uniref:coilin n=1 Tax=Euphorbia lathyris TaxID=212925 RepID=UPI003313994C
METVRLRLTFDHILNKSLKTRGLDRCWVQLKPQHQTISDLSSYILHAFNLQDECPRGLLLSMDEFSLPPFESTSILKDKDIIRVEKIGGVSSDILMIGNGENHLEAVQIVDMQPVASAMNLLANEEFEKESGGYQSEEEEDAQEQEENEIHIESTPEDKNVSRKRKASKEIKSSKRKKSKPASSEDCADVVEDIANNANGEQNGSLRTSEVKEKRRKKSKSASSEDCANVVKDIANNANGEQNGSLKTSKVKAKRSCEAQENCNGNVDTSHSPTAKKLASRSARRKKAKRRFLKGIREAERKELRRKQLHEKSDQQSDEEDQPSNQMVCQESAEKGNEEVFEELPEKETEELQEDQKLPEKETEELQEDQKLPDEDNDVEEDVVPMVIRPGHIRFVPLGEEDTVQTENQSQIPRDNFQWNGVTSKKKGQKWGREKTTSYRRNDHKDVNQEQPKVLKGAGHHLNFENLEFYTTLPKVGDVIAYRLIELSSSWTPELSSYRVGKISRYDMKSNRLRLVQVPGYPFFPETDHDPSDFQPEPSPYQADGSLWTEFSALIEVRLVRHGKSNPETDSRTNNDADAASQENGTVNPWEEISQALSAKKEQLSQEDEWNKPESSGGRSWSYRSLRGSALGPTVAYLRGQNEI